MAPKLPILTGRVICNQVKLLEVIGFGGSGIVYRGIRKDASPCAVKCLRNSDRSLHEVTLHRSVSDHPNIIKIEGTFAIGNFMFIVMEYCPGGDLLTAIEDGRFQNQDDLVKSAFIQILDALHWCHENKVSHRDIKPENILCNTDCSQVRLADFGLSCTEAFSVEFLNGTPGYLSPECIGAERQFLAYSTVKTDIWALGIVLVSMVAGNHPWEEALSTDFRFSAYMKNPEILLSMLSISRETYLILNSIFTLDPADRVTLPELRDSIMRVENFFPSDPPENMPILRVVNCATTDRLDSSSSSSDQNRPYSPRLQSSKPRASIRAKTKALRSLSCSDSHWYNLHLDLGEDSNDDSESDPFEVVRRIKRSWTSVSSTSAHHIQLKPISLTSLYDDYWDSNYSDGSSESKSSSSSLCSGYSYLGMSLESRPLHC